MTSGVRHGTAPVVLRRAATLLSRLPEPIAYALYPFLVHGGLDRWLLPRESEVAVEALDGAVFALDPHDEIAREILHFGAYEKRNIEIMRKLTRGVRGTFLDIGANLGNHALNGLSKARVFDVGLSDVNASLAFLAEQGSNPGASRFLEAGDGAEADGVPRLEARIGDELVTENDLGPVTAIKIDVEGHEERVIAGLAKTIAEYRPLIFMEWDARRNGPGCFDRLSGYRFHAQPWELSGGRWWRPFARGIDAARAPRLVRVEPDDLKDRYISMLVGIPSERPPEL
jgi:FkbM family methyltransferase